MLAVLSDGVLGIDAASGRAGDPVADDLASLPLDLMLADEGVYARSGYNPLLVFGE